MLQRSGAGVSEGAMALLRAALFEAHEAELRIVTDTHLQAAAGAVGGGAALDELRHNHRWIRLFKEMDTDGSGELDEQEFIQAVRCVAPEWRAPCLSCLTTEPSLDPSPRTRVIYAIHPESR